MSWSLTITADRPIEEGDLRRALSRRDISRFPLRQKWGWPSGSTDLGVDVDLPDGETLTICGADFSAHLAGEAAKKIASGLRKLGYAVHVGSISW